MNMDVYREEDYGALNIAKFLQNVETSVDKIESLSDWRKWGYMQQGMLTGHVQVLNIFQTLRVKRRRIKIMLNKISLEKD